MIILAGCGRSGNTAREIVFDTYSIEIPEIYIEVPPVLVENKQLLNKIIKSFKVRVEGISQFEPNIIISRSEISAQLDFEGFWIANTQKLGGLLAGYTPGDKELMSFPCAERDIQGILATFSVEDPWYENAKKIRLAQYQFVDNNIGYIISAAYATEKEGKAFQKIIKTLQCTQKD